MTRNILIASALLVSTGAIASQESRGVALYREGKFADAANVLKTEVDKAPNDVAKLTYLGLARVESGNAQAAIQPLEKAIATNEKYAEAHYGMGRARIKLNQLDKAVAALEKAASLNSSHAYTHYHLGMTYNKTGRKDLGIGHLRRFVELAPKAPEAPAVRSFLSRL